jgi:hypothetical protein
MKSDGFTRMNLAYHTLKAFAHVNEDQSSPTMNLLAVVAAQFLGCSMHRIQDLFEQQNSDVVDRKDVIEIVTTELRICINDLNKIPTQAGLQ